MAVREMFNMNRIPSFNSTTDSCRGLSGTTTCFAKTDRKCGINFSRVTVFPTLVQACDLNPCCSKLPSFYSFKIDAKSLAENQENQATRKKAGKLKMSVAASAEPTTASPIISPLLLPRSKLPFPPITLCSRALLSFPHRLIFTSSPTSAKSNAASPPPILLPPIDRPGTIKFNMSSTLPVCY